MMRAEHLEAIKTADKAYYEDDVVGWDVSEKRKLGYIRQNTPFEATMCSDDYVIDTSDDYVWERAKTIFN